MNQATESISDAPIDPPSGTKQETPRESPQSGIRSSLDDKKDISDLLNGGNDLDTAIAFTRIKKNIEIDPSSLTGFIKTLVQPGREDHFIKFCRMIIQSGNCDLKITLFLINAILPEKARFAESVLKSAEKRFPEDPEMLHTFGKVYILMEQPEKAIVYLERLLAAQPGNLDARIDLGRAYEDFKQTKKAYEIYVQGLELHPANTRIIYTIARQCYVTGNIQDARRIVRRILEIDPSHSKARILHTRIREKIGYASEAEACAEKQILDEGPNPHNVFERAYQFVRCHKLEESVLYLRNLIEEVESKKLEGIDVPADHLKKYQEYLEMCESNLGFDESTRDILNDFADNPCDDEELKIIGFNPALKHYLDLHKSDPENPEHLEKLSILYLGEQDIGTALLFSRKLEEIDPLNPGNIIRIAVIEIRRGKHFIAIPLLQKLLKTNPNNRLARNLFRLYTRKIPR